MDPMYKALECAFKFQRNTDNYGKLFSLLPFLTKLCPEACDYKIARESALNLRQFFKVRRFNLSKLFLNSFLILRQGFAG